MIEARFVNRDVARIVARTTDRIIKSEGLESRKLAVSQAVTFNNYARRMRRSRKSPQAFDVMKVLARSPICFEIYGTLLDLDRPVTPYELLEMGFAEATIFRAFKKLREYGLIACVGITRPGRSLGGPRPSLWMVV